MASQVKATEIESFASEKKKKKAKNRENKKEDFKIFEH